MQPATADLTPMLDTIFLIILLLLATLMNSSIVRGFPVNLPAFSEKTSIQKEDNSIEVSVNEDGFVYVGKERTDLENIAEVLQMATIQRTSSKVLLRADSSTDYGRVAEVLCCVSNSLPDKQVILVTQKNHLQVPRSAGLPEEVVSPVRGSVGAERDVQHEETTKGVRK
jgi:biopolymer transport protein ExbD